MAARKREDLADVREALLSQLAYLLDEIEALRGVIGRVPEAVLAGRPVPGDRTIKEMYGLVAAADERVYLPRLQAMAAGTAPQYDEMDEPALAAATPWNEWAMDDIFARIEAARSRMLAFLRALPPSAWDEGARIGDAHLTVYDVAHRITQHDVRVLREAGYRLHDSRLSDRPERMPR